MTYSPEQLYVLYDGACGLCARFRQWLTQQPKFVPLVFIPLQDATLEERFPGVRAQHPEREILVIDERGQFYRGPQAWVMCLWALKRYRELSLRLAAPELLPVVQKVCTLVSSHRLRLSQVLGLHDQQLVQRVSSVVGPSCDSQQCVPMSAAHRPRGW